MTLEAQRSDSGVAPLAIPAHVAIIMDGNGRWAERQGMPRLAGHRAGAENLRSIIGAAARVGRPVRHAVRVLDGELGQAERRGNGTPGTVGHGD